MSDERQPKVGSRPSIDQKTANRQKNVRCGGSQSSPQLIDEGDRQPQSAGHEHADDTIMVFVIGGITHTEIRSGHFAENQVFFL